MENYIRYTEEHQERFVEELFDLLRIPSISADSKYKEEVAKAADFIRNALEKAGANNVEIIPTAGHPAVYGEKIIDPSLSTVLVYGHYDVQPPDPYDLWETPPFEPTVRDGKIYARGSADDKGQMYMHIKAFEALVATENLDCNVKFLIEGEEEVGSDNLEKLLVEQKEKLKADIVLVSDTDMLANDTPSITVGLRGLSYLEVELTGPNRDLHSGLYGGAVQNPINALAKMIASITDENNHITVPNFYDDVAELSEQERERLAEIPFDMEAYKKHLSIDEVAGEKGYSTYERTSIRPTFDLNGIWGGYIGEGAKTVLPSKAYAKLSMRLVPNQSSEKITHLFEEHFKAIAPEGVKVKVTPHHGGEPYLADMNSKYYRSAENAVEATFGKKPFPVRGGGSIPITQTFRDVLGLDTILMGFGLAEDAIHSPNESYGLYNYQIGIETIGFFYYFLAREND